MSETYDRFPNLGHICQYIVGSRGGEYPPGTPTPAVTILDPPVRGMRFGGNVGIVLQVSIMCENRSDAGDWYRRQNANSQFLCYLSNGVT